MPLLCARYNPQLYEIFKAFLWSNLLFGRNSLYYDATADYYSDHARFYGVSNWSLYESAIIWACIFGIILIANGIVHFIHKRTSYQKDSGLQRTIHMSDKPTMLEKVRRQFRFNIYIRFMMFAYFDIITICFMGVWKESESWLTVGKFFSIVGVAALIILPCVVIGALLYRFEFFLDKSSKKTLGALLEKIDKGTRVRAIQPAFFFLRRIITAFMIATS
jgi:hypothetical protein